MDPSVRHPRSHTHVFDMGSSAAEVSRMSPCAHFATSAAPTKKAQERFFKESEV